MARTPSSAATGAAFLDRGRPVRLRSQRAHYTGTGSPLDAANFECCRDTARPAGRRRCHVLLTCDPPFHRVHYIATELRLSRYAEQ
jgi:hypothetical protein